MSGIKIVVVFDGGNIDVYDIGTIQRSKKNQRLCPAVPVVFLSAVVNIVSGSLRSEYIFKIYIIFYFLLFNIY